jgi:hypothetical protein
MMRRRSRRMGIMRMQGGERERGRGRRREGLLLPELMEQGPLLEYQEGQLLPHQLHPHQHIQGEWHQPTGGVMGRVKQGPRML